RTPDESRLREFAAQQAAQSAAQEAAQRAAQEAAQQRARQAAELAAQRAARRATSGMATAAAESLSRAACTPPTFTTGRARALAGRRIFSAARAMAVNRCQRKYRSPR